MKRFTVLFIFGLIILSQGFAQSRPIMGYDQVEWGSSIENVKRVYGIGDEIPLNSGSNFFGSETDQNITFFVQHNVSDSIVERIFYFNKWNSDNYRLYRVWVVYSDTSNSARNNLQSAIASRFGRQTNYKIEDGTTTLMFQRLNYIQETWEYGTYTPELVVELIHRLIYAGVERDDRNLLGQNWLRVCYTWKKFRDNYQASRLGL